MFILFLFEVFILVFLKIGLFILVEFYNFTIVNDGDCGEMYKLRIVTLC